MDDIKNLAVKVESKEQAEEVMRWLNKHGFKNERFYHRYDPPNTVVTIGHFGEACVCHPHSLNADDKEPISYTDWKSRFAGSDEKEEWVRDNVINGRGFFENVNNFTSGKWYKIIDNNNNRFYILNDRGEKTTWDRTDQFQFSSTPPSEDKKVIEGWRLKKLYPNCGMAAKVGDIETLNYAWAIQYPEFYEPVYAPEKPVEEVITLNMIDFKIGKGTIEIKECGGWKKTIPAEWFAFDEQLAKLEKMTIGGYSPKNIVAEFHGMNFSRSDGQKIISIYQKINS